MAAEKIPFFKKLFIYYIIIKKSNLGLLSCQFYYMLRNIDIMVLNERYIKKKGGDYGGGGVKKYSLIIF